MDLSNISDQIIVTENIYKLNTVNSLMSSLNYCITSAYYYLYLVNHVITVV